MTNSNIKLKNHVSAKAGRLGGALKSKFNVSINDFNAAINGDIAAAQKIGEAARQGRLSAELAPKLAQAYQEIIAGTTAYNKAVSEILVSAGKSAIEIDKAAMQATLANTQYGHKRSELAAEFVSAKASENQRHQYQMNYTQIKGYIDVYLAGVEQRATLLDQSNRPELKQIQANESYDAKVLNEALNRGDKANFELIQKRDYQASNIKESVANKFNALKSALGF